ncbi:MAG: universal stress protein [Bdellovibrionia bacterium]
MNDEKSAVPRRIVWAVDAFDDPEHLRSLAPQLLNSLARQQNWGHIEVVPVYVLSPGDINLTIEFSGLWLEQYREAAQKALEHALKDIQVANMAHPEVIAENFTATAQAARSLAMHAKAMNAEMIVVPGHGRKGLGRFLTGSFAENVIQYSHVPVVILRPKIKISPKIQTILVPTQFGTKAKAVFRKIVDQAHGLGARIVLFHTIPHPVEPILQSGAYLAGGSWVPVQAYFSVETDRHRRRAEAWARWAENQGVPTEVIVDVQGSDIGDSIVYLAKSRNADLVAMESRSGPIASTLLGSITRHVIRNAQCPVWVYRPAFAVAPGAHGKPARRAA